MGKHSYRAFLLGSDGHIVHRVELGEYESDHAAMERAKLLVDGHDVELWDGPRLVAEFKAGL